MHAKTKQITVIAMLCALAFAAVAFCRIPVVLFLKYEPKDAVIAIGGFMFGPLTALIASLLVSVLEMLLLSDTGLYGLLMNVLSTCAFVLPAALIYRRRHTAGGAVLGLLIGSLLMVATMLLWNWLIVPLYTGTPREKVAEMLLPTFLPFNLLKSGLNAAITLLLYKPVITAFRKAHLIPTPPGGEKAQAKIGLLAGALALLAVSVILMLVLAGVL